MTDRYAVFGHPIAHSLSPQIHTQFARQTGQDLTYEAIQAPLDGFSVSLLEFQEAGGKGANITLPFKEEAYRLCTRLTPRAERAQSANTLLFSGGVVTGDNTDGAGLVADLTQNLSYSLKGKTILLLGAGGAARGVIDPLLAGAPDRLVIANRTARRAETLAAHFKQRGTITSCGLDEVDASFDLVINATAASLGGESLPLSGDIFKPSTLAYDMMYGKNLTPFMQLAQQHGAQVADGLGMLVEQAAEAFNLWRGVRPNTHPVIAALRAA